MQRPSKRHAGRKVVQELTGCLEQRSEPLPPIKSAADRSMLHSTARVASCLSNLEIEAKAKALCADDGLDPDQNVTHAYGDDFTVQEWEYRWTSNTAVSCQPVVSPIWRLYRARAAIALSRARKAVEYTSNVVPFRRRNG